MTEGSNITETLYNGTFIYKKVPSQSYELDYIITEEGRLTPTIDPSVYKIEYYLKDLPIIIGIGNVRAILTDSETNPGTPELIKESHYYPFGQEFMGMSITQTGDVNNYKYNGKELQTELGLDWYDYGARYYDPQLARFHTLDPLSETYSFQTPFVYAVNNPIRFIDFMGMNATKYEDELGNEIVPETQDGSTDVVWITDDKLTGFKASFKGTSEEMRNSTEMNNVWKAYSGNNIKSDKLDPSTLGRNYFNSNYIGPYNPQTYPDSEGKRKSDYSAPPVNLAGYVAMIHDKSYDKLGIEGKSGLFKDTRAIGADYRFVGTQMQMGKLSLMTGDYYSAFSAYSSGLLLGGAVAGKTLLQLSKPMGASEIMMWDKVSQPTK